MKTIDIIEGFNRLFETKYPDKGYFISKLNIEQSKLSKIYKTYSLEIWYINKKDKTLINTIQKSARVTDNMDEKIIKELNIELSYVLFRDYEKLMKYGI